jgi:hypothetical protein
MQGAVQESTATLTQRVSGVVLVKLDFCDLVDFDFDALGIHAFRPLTERDRQVTRMPLPCVKGFDQISTRWDCVLSSTRRAYAAEAYAAEMWTSAKDEPPGLRYPSFCVTLPALEGAEVVAWLLE